MPVKIIHTIWATTPMPDYATTIIDRWRTLHPDWEHVHWDDEALSRLTFRHQEFYDDAESLTTEIYYAGMLRSDLARYEILHLFGGLYVDCGIEPLKPIDDLVAGVEFGAGWETDDEWIANGLLYAAQPGNVNLAAIIAGVADKIATREPTWRPNRLTGPQYITPILANGQDVTLWPSRLVYPVRWDALGDLKNDHPDAYTRCLWPNMHRRHGKQVPVRA